MSTRATAEVSAARSARLFLAIALPDGVRAELQKAQNELRALLPSGGIAWTKPENLHLTLRFLGNIDSSRIGELAERIATALAGFGKLHLHCERLGCFPDLQMPRVIWAWVHDAVERLEALHHRIEAVVADLAQFPAETRFVGHVTVARVKQLKRTETERLSRCIASTATRRFGDWDAACVLLVRSELSPAGAIYTELFRANLS